MNQKYRVADFTHPYQPSVTQRQFGERGVEGTEEDQCPAHGAPVAVQFDIGEEDAKAETVEEVGPFRPRGILLRKASNDKPSKEHQWGKTFREERGIVIWGLG